jgi:hypothetical protein
LFHGRHCTRLRGRLRRGQWSLNKSSKSVNINQSGDRFPVLSNEIRYAADPSIHPGSIPGRDTFSSVRRNRKIWNTCATGQILNHRWIGNIGSMLPEHSIQRRGETVSLGRVSVHRRRDGCNRRRRVRLPSWKRNRHLGCKSLDGPNLARKFRCERGTGVCHWSGKVRGVLNATPVDPVGKAQRNDSFAEGVTERTIEVAVQHEIGSHGA